MPNVVTRSRAAKKTPAWHALFGGPATIFDLAQHLRLAGLYELLYRPLSGSTHSANAMRGAFSFGPNGETALLQLRTPGDAQFDTLIAVGLALDIFAAYRDFYTPERKPECDSWYLTIRDRFLALSRGTLINTQA